MERLPFEAEISTDTRFPIIVADRRYRTAAVLRGEDFGVDDPAKIAQANAERFRREAEEARSAVEAARAAVASSEAEIAALKERALQLRLEAGQAVIAESRAEREAKDAQAAVDAAERAASEADEKLKQRTAATEDVIRRAVLENEDGIDLHILFDTGRATLRQDAHTREQLAALGRALSGGLRDLTIEIGGHTDAAGEPRFDNVGLSLRRAETVRQHLIKTHGLPADKLFAQGYGSAMLKNAQNKLASENRRVQIKARLDPEARRARIEEARRAAAELQGLAAEAGRMTAALQAQIDAAANAERARQEAAAAAEKVRAAQRDTDRAEALLVARRRELDAALPRAEDAQSRADQNARESRTRARAAAERAEGVFIVSDSRDHMAWFTSDPQLKARFAHSLREGFNPAAGGTTANATFRLKREGQATDLADAVAAELVAMDPARSGVREIFRTFTSDISGHQRWLGVTGRVARDGTFMVAEPINQFTAPRKPEPPKPIEVTVVRSEDVPMPVPLGAATVEAGGPRPVRAAGAGADAASGQGTPDGGRTEAAQAFAEAFERAQARLDAQRRLAALQDRAARANAAADAARKRLGELQGEADRIGAAAARYREQLTRAQSSVVEASVAFDHDSAEPKSTEGLMPLCEALKSPELMRSRFFIQGHTNRAGRESAEYNRGLSQRRAAAVLGVFMRCGLPASRFQVQGFGFDRPLPNLPPEAPEHRRVLVGKL